ncbi:MAG: transcriptional repressor, partial [Candidatus Omnitrophica bacterium]|nr:transcriptional repressor [Candidatus Omnitrophota bacterium]
TGLSHFDAVVHSHYHFICKNCRKIYDIRIPSIKELDDKVRTLTGFRIYSHRLEFFGLCDACNERQIVR